MTQMCERGRGKKIAAGGLYFLPTWEKILSLCNFISNITKPS